MTEPRMDPISGKEDGAGGGDERSEGRVGMVPDQQLRALEDEAGTERRVHDVSGGDRERMEQGDLAIKPGDGGEKEQEMRVQYE